MVSSLTAPQHASNRTQFGNDPRLWAVQQKPFKEKRFMRRIQYIRGVLLAMTIAALPIGAVWAASATDAEVAIKNAEAARKKAASVGGEWRDTGKIIKKAKEEIQGGDFNKAIFLANQAYNQGELGYQQAMKQKKIDFPKYLH
jgi:hypothetical protein